MKYQVSLHTKHHIFIHEDNMLFAHMKDHTVAMLHIKIAPCEMI